jgi:hypothetical protein
MKKINAKFIAGMLAMALVFGMAFAGCDTGTSSGGSGTDSGSGGGGGSGTGGGSGGGTTPPPAPVPGSIPADAIASSWADIEAKFASLDEVYVTSHVSGAGALAVLKIPSGKTLYVTNGAANSASQSVMDGGALFSVLPQTYKTSLTIPRGYTLKVEEGGNLVMGGLTADTGSGVLNVETGGTLHVNKDARLAVNTASRVVVKGTASDSASIILETDSYLAVGGTVSPSGRVFGTSDDGTTLIPILGEDSPAAIGDITVVTFDAKTGEYVENKTLQSAVGKEAGDIIEASPAKIADSIKGLETLFEDENAKEVKFSGDTLEPSNPAEPEIVVPADKTLVLENDAALKAGTTLALAEAGGDPGSVAASLEIPEDVTLTVEKGSVVDISALFTSPTDGVGGGTPQGAVDLEGEIVIVKGATLKLSHGDGSGKIPEINFGEHGRVKVMNGANVVLAPTGTIPADVPYIGSGGFYTWTATTDANAAEYLILDANGFSLYGGLTFAKVITVGIAAQAVVETGTLTISEALKIEPTGELIVKNGANVVITSTSPGSLAFNGTGGKITNDGTITTSDATVSHFTDLVGKSAGNGKVVLKAAVTGATGPIALSQNLDIAAGGSIAYTGSATEAFKLADGVTGKAVTISGTTAPLSSGKLDLGSVITSIGVPVTNNGTEADAIKTATTSAGTLHELMKVGGNITASGTVTFGASDPNEVTVPENVTLTVTGTTGLTIASGKTPRMDGAIKKGTTGTVANSGTIRASNINYAKITDLLAAANGKIVIPNFTVGGGQTLAIGTDTALTVSSGSTLTLDGTNATSLAQITLAAGASGTKATLVLEEGGKLNVTNAFGTIVKASASSGPEMTVTVAHATNGSATKATVGGNVASGWTITTGTTVANLEIILGQLKLAGNTGGITASNAAPESKAGSLTAGSNTTITFSGTL